MPESWNDQFRKGDELPQPGIGAPFEPFEPSEARRGWGLWVAIALLVFAAGLAIFFVVGRPPDGSEPAPLAEIPPQPDILLERAEPLGTDVEPLDLPPLGEADALVRSLVGQLSSHPRVAAWLATDGLIRNFTVVVSNVAEGKTPAVNLRRLRPAGEFAVRERGEDLVIDPESYERYAALVDGFESMDPAAAARLYVSLKPRIDEAYAELGFPGTTFDAALERAIVLLLRTPVPSDPIKVEPQGATGYGFADPALERLTPAQKHLIRMGPRNARRVQAVLRAMALALGIPPNRLSAGESR